MELIEKKMLRENSALDGNAYVRWSSHKMFLLENFFLFLEGHSLQIDHL